MRSSAANFRLPLEEAQRRYRACDICCVDLDQCVFPTFTQIVLGTMVVGKALITPGLWPRLGSLLSGGTYIAGARLRKMRGDRPSNDEMMARFSSVMAGMPIDVIESLARILPSMSFPGWRDAMALISARMPTGLLSFSIEPIIEAYRRTNGWRGQRIFDLASGTPVDVGQTVRGPVLVACHQPEEDLTGQAKLRTLRQWMSDCRAATPLVIGHGPDETPMAEFARQRGGLSIGFRPFDDWADHFDITVDALTWRPVTRLLRLLEPAS